MPNRVIKESIKTSKNVNSLSDFQFRLWVHLIISADDFGRGNADPELIKNLAFPRRHGITEKQLSDALHVLASLGMVVLYEVDGESYYYFPKWSEHQRVRQKVSRFPEPSPVSELPQVAADCGELPQNAAECGEVRPEYRIQNTEYRIQKKNIYPTREEVREYAKQRNSDIDPDRFYDFYTADPSKPWTDTKGKPVKNWKQKFITWEGRESTDGGKRNTGGGSPGAGEGAGKWGNLYATDAT